MTDTQTNEPKRFRLKAADNRSVAFHGPPVSELPEWGGVAESRGVRFVLHPPLDFELAYKIEEYLFFTPFVRAVFDLSVNDSPVRRKTNPAGTGFIVPPGTTIRCRLADPAEFLCIIVESERAEAVFNLVAGERVWVPELIETFVDPGFAFLAGEIRRSLLGDPLMEPAYLGSLADSIMARIGCHYAGLDMTIPEGKETLAPGLLKRIVQKVETNLGDPLSVESLAEDAGYSRSHFSRAFQSVTGESPQDFIIGRRVCKARELLSETDTPIAEIAAKTGFSSQAHFSTAFKKRLGVTPGKYRNAFV